MLEQSVRQLERSMLSAFRSLECGLSRQVRLYQRSLKSERLRMRVGEEYIELSSRDEANRTREERQLTVDADPRTCVTGDR